MIEVICFLKAEEMFRFRVQILEMSLRCLNAVLWEVFDEGSMFRGDIHLRALSEVVSSYTPVSIKNVVMYLVVEGAC